MKAAGSGSSSRSCGRPVDGASIWLGGTTASGKSAIALHLAERLQGEIVSVDSMQVYRGMDIGTAKPSPRDRARVEHHLVDVVRVGEPFNVSNFLAEATQAIGVIRQRNSLPLLCGGTGLYFKALLDGIGSGPEPDPELRSELEATPQAALLEELRCFAPQTWSVIDTRNPRRVVRAVEILRLSGGGPLEQRAPWHREPSEDVPFFRIQRGREDLRHRIDHRVDRMFERGLVGETERLLEEGLAQNRGALQAIGYRQVAEHLQGARGLDETIALVKQRTWDFARRQRNWFERQLSTEEISVAPDEDPEQTATRLHAIVRERRTRGSISMKTKA